MVHHPHANLLPVPVTAIQPLGFVIVSLFTCSGHLGAFALQAAIRPANPRKTPHPSASRLHDGALALRMCVFCASICEARPSALAATAALMPLQKSSLTQFAPCPHQSRRRITQSVEHFRSPARRAPKAAPPVARRPLAADYESGAAALRDTLRPGLYTYRNKDVHVHDIPGMRQPSAPHFASIRTHVPTNSDRVVCGPMSAHTIPSELQVSFAEPEAPRPVSSPSPARPSGPVVPYTTSALVPQPWAKASAIAPYEEDHNTGLDSGEDVI
eukprot:gene9885-1781_t